MENQKVLIEKGKKYDELDATSTKAIAKLADEIRELQKKNEKLMSAHTFVIEFVDAMGDKGNLTIHETALLDSAKNIIKQ